MKLSTVQTITIVPAQNAQTVQADTIVTKWNDDESSVTADLTFSNSTVQNGAFATRRRTITLWDSTTTPTYASTGGGTGNWTEDEAKARVLTVLGLTA